MTDPAPDGAAQRPGTAVVPVKPLALAKSRLAVPAAQRRRLALAFALDTVAALSGCPDVAEVLVVTADPDVERGVRRRRVRVVPDGGAGLRAAVRAGCGAATSRTPGTRVLVVPADLPCLRPDDVTLVLASTPPAVGAFVPDHLRTGTTLLVCPPGRAALAQYGPGSAARHRALGLRSLDDAPLRARHDVDTLADLRVASALGLGAETAVAVAGVAGVAGVEACAARGQRGG